MGRVCEKVAGGKIKKEKKRGREVRKASGGVSVLGGGECPEKDTDNIAFRANSH